MQDALRSFSEVGLFYTCSISKEFMMKYVYLLESIGYPGKRYIGITNNFNDRLKEHNAGKSPHTTRFKPWKAVVAIRFMDDRKADVFEKYLKSGLGHAFANRHLW